MWKSCHFCPFPVGMDFECLLSVVVIYSLYHRRVTGVKHNARVSLRSLGQRLSIQVREATYSEVAMEICKNNDANSSFSIQIYLNFTSCQCANVSAFLLWGKRTAREGSAGKMFVLEALLENISPYLIWEKWTAAFARLHLDWCGWALLYGWYSWNGIYYYWCVSWL